ncbi:MAG: acetaldehyde dehydrogenase (acetylating) [Sediminibacterium sp.]|nr:acetaldehyde dehydrogenase (acetylating) [Sediminibacterium sp.]
MSKKLKVAIIGTGNIGTDLLIKIQRSSLLECVCFVGRNINSPGIAKAISMGVKISDKSIEAILEDIDNIDLLFDATSAKDALYHWELLKDTKVQVIDLTPAKIGIICVPSINLNDVLKSKNINMITCAGQASIPMAYTLSKTHPDIDYIEIVVSSASVSAGPATRSNIEEFLDTTQKGLKQFANVSKAKVILNLNSVIPYINMQITIYANISNPNMELISTEMYKMAEQINKYVPGYSLVVPPTFENGRFVVMIKVVGLGDYLPTFAGNLDIINCAAIAVAEHISIHK